MKKVKGALLCAAALLFAVCGFAACGGKGGNLEIVLVEEAFRDDVYVNSEFDVMAIVENANDAWTYSLTECYYLDGSFERHDLAVSGGTKFTSTVATDVYCTLRAEDKRGNTDEEEFVLEVKVPTRVVERTFIEWWNDPGVVKTMTSNPAELPAGVQAGVKVSYSGTYNPVNDGVHLGGVDSKATDLSLTSWENAVFTMKVYNPNEFDLTMGVQLVKDNALYHDLGFAAMDQFNLPAGEWTDAQWSFRRLGLNYDILEDGVTIVPKVRINSTDGMTQPYAYTIVICNMDVADYSAEKFPDLETRTEEEIFEQSPGDIEDKYLVMHAVANSETVNANYALTRVAAEVVPYEDGEIAAPDGTEGSESFVRYTVTPSRQTDGYWAVPVSFSTEVGGVEIDPEYLGMFAAEDWSNAYLGFWVYNASDADLSFYSHKPDGPTYWGGRGIAVPSGKWTYVEFSLAQDYTVTENILENDTYTLRVFSHYNSAAADFSGTFYIDGFDIYNK